ncbi:penicillin-binding protein 2 [Candidatus Nomurabacteria bacterium]|nr:penicillin-binding protein 2 [Candidatus Nomurabacteria bacterium]
MEAVSHSRIRFLTAALLFIFGVIVLRLFWMQVVQHDKYSVLANNEQVRKLIVPANRGEIYALDMGKPVHLVLNEPVFTVFADPVIIDEPDEIVNSVRSIAGGTARSGLEKLVRAKPSRYQILATNVTRKQAKMLKDKNLTGLGFQPTTRRIYPEKELASQVLGFVNAEGKGQYGVESGLDKRLRGTDGLLQSVTDPNNVPLTIGKNNLRKPAINGENIVLTIDRNIQSYTEQALKHGMKKAGATFGSALVMNPQDGSVVAMANFPTYKPEEFTKVMDPAAFNNAIISSPYEPGSVMKTFTLATGIDRGVVTPESTYLNTDKITVDDRTIENAAKGQLGQVSMQTALNWSLNTGMVTIAQRLGDGNYINSRARNTMYSYLHDKFRLGKETGIDIAGEAAGYMVPPNSGEGNAVRYSNMSFGQGMNLTMLQVASGFSAMVNGGEYYSPRIVAGTVNEDGEYVAGEKPKSKGQVIKSATSSQMRKMIYDARRAFHADGDKKGYFVGGKTGTSQTLVNGKYDFGQTVGTYLGFGGDTAPKYVIMIQVSAPGKALEGNTHAMPIFTDISNWMIDYLQLRPRS